MLISDAGTPGRSAIDILLRPRPTFGVNIMVRSPEQIEQRLALGDFFLRVIMTKGRVVYARPHH
ncbi:MAG: hypothetical protein IT340_15510 [Chloroflexi bacterium]|nr:hypothetical protein [Chloroflexota bacterium]